MQVIRPYITSYRPLKSLVPRRVPVVRKPVIKPKVSEVEVVSYYVGKSIILFTMLYCTMNWWHYKTLRESQEKKDDDK